VWRRFGRKDPERRVAGYNVVGIHDNDPSYIHDSDCCHDGTYDYDPEFASERRSASCRVGAKSP